MTIEELRDQAMAMAEPQFKKFEPIALANTEKVLAAFKECRLSDYHFNGTTGYGYNDSGRELLDEVFAHVFKAEKALVRAHFVSGTHALATTLTAILGSGSEGREFVYAVGAPYDTMQSVIGAVRDVRGSLTEKGFIYKEVPLKDGTYDLEGIKAAVNDQTRVVVIQRSRGYSTREPLSCEDIGRICAAVKSVNPKTVCFVDNCYGEFTELTEPLEHGADIMAGSLIKNAGGGLAPIGGYIVGKKECVENAAYRLTSPGLGKEVGASLGVIQSFYQGLFLAPTVVSGALKGAIFAADIYEKLGYKVVPDSTESRHDIIQAVEFQNREAMIAFCEGIQAAAPVDSYVTPEPWAMPGYDCDVIMAAGAFVQGSSIELSADGPVKPPYAVYFQGGLTWYHAKLGILMSLQKLYERNLVNIDELC